MLPCPFVLLDAHDRAHLARLSRLCVRGVFCSSVFPLASPLPSTASAAARPALFGGFAGTTGLSDFPRSCISGLRPWPSRAARPAISATGERGISRFPRMEIPCMLRFFDRAGSAGDSR